MQVLQCNVPAEVAHQIELDVPRTKPQWMSEADCTMLQRVLLAYASYDPEVGYCQGMSDIASVFVLLGFDDSASLNGLCSMLNCCCPDYFCPSLKGYVLDLSVLQVLVCELLPPEAVQVLDSMDVPLHTLAADHFLALASHTWPLEAVVRLWDLFFLHGSSAVFASFLAVLQVYLPAQREASTQGPEKVEALMNSISSGVAKDLDTILVQTRQLIPHIPMSRIESLRLSCQASLGNPPSLKHRHDKAEAVYEDGEEEEVDFDESVVCLFDYADDSVRT